jgi:carboxyl-terminal processing protease
MRDIGRARVFGVRTAGAALPSIVVKLPNDDRFQYAVANYISAGGKTLEGDGVVPDEVVVPDRKALLAGKDPILDAAVRWCEKQSRSGNH